MRLTIVGTSLVTVIALAALGCETTNPFTGERQPSKASQGVALGAVGGAVVGIVTGSTRKALLLGAGVGALAGGLVGRYMDQEEAKLRAQLEGTGVSVTRYGNQLVLNMPGNVTFASNSADISADFYPVLDSVALVLKEFRQTYIDIIGHTDNTGSLELNQQLSEQRALSVFRYLESREVLDERFVTQGKGPNAPIADNDTPEGRALNRRVEIVLTPVA